ncbi:MAG: SHOCT domain-containing protein [Candidatus Saccharimonadales bacterium]
MARTAVVAGTATAVSNRVSRRQATKWSNEAEAEQESQAVEQQAQTSPATTSDPMEQLKQLGDLHAQGILTDEEFTAKKQQLLNQV